MRVKHSDRLVSTDEWQPLTNGGRMISSIYTLFLQLAERDRALQSLQGSYTQLERRWQTAQEEARDNSAQLELTKSALQQTQRKIQTQTKEVGAKRSLITIKYPP